MVFAVVAAVLEGVAVVMWWWVMYLLLLAVLAAVAFHAFVVHGVYEIEVAVLVVAVRDICDV